MKRVAAVDLGTNTFNLLIAESQQGRLGRRVLVEEFPVKLGEGGINEGYIAPEAFRRGLQTLKHIAGLLDNYQTVQVLAYATSAIRSAANGGDFISAALQETGIQIVPVDGDREAELIYKGVRAGTQLNRPSLIVDIGGGSVELILCDEQKIHWKKSYPIGAARLRERYHQTDPADPADIEQLYHHLDETLADFAAECRVFRPVQLIGSAGAFETFEAILTHRSGQTKPDGASYLFEKDELEDLLDFLIGSTKQQRENLPGLIAFRVDMIVMAAALTKYLMHRTRVEKVLLSTYSLKEGMLSELIEATPNT